MGSGYARGVTPRGVTLGGRDVIAYASIMVRSGLLLLILAVTLSGCAAGTATEPSPSATATATPEAATCPAGLAAALEAHLAAQPFAGELPVEANVVEFPEMTFASPVVAAMSGCVFTTEIVLSDGGRMFQIFGISDDLDEEGIIATVRAAGWEQPFPDTEPGVWQDPAYLEEGVAIFPQGVAERPALDFPDWAGYLDPDDVLLLSSVRM